MAVLAEEGAVRHIVVHSSGNYARSIAHAARLYGIKVTAVLPDTAPPVKVDAVRRLGAEVLVVPPAQRESAASDLCAESGGRLVPADEFAAIAGAGTVGLEIVHDLPETAAILVPVCSGSQLAGISAVLKAEHPSVRVIGVEPELAADGAESLRRGALTSWPVELTYRTVADGLRAPSMGRLAWAHIRRFADDILTVDEDAIVEASALLRTSTGVTAEPSGAVGLAAWLRHRETLPRGPVVAVVTGATRLRTPPDP